MAENGGKTSAQIFKELKGKQKVQFIYDYYKIPILLALVALLLFLTTLHSVLTRKEEILTVALVNVRTPRMQSIFSGKPICKKTDIPPNAGRLPSWTNCLCHQGPPVQSPQIMRARENLLPHKYLLLKKRIPNMPMPHR